MLLVIKIRDWKELRKRASWDCGQIAILLDHDFAQHSWKMLPLGEQRIEMLVESWIDYHSPIWPTYGRSGKLIQGSWFCREWKPQNAYVHNPPCLTTTSQEGKEKTTLREKLLLLLEPNPEAGARQSEMMRWWWKHKSSHSSETDGKWLITPQKNLRAMVYRFCLRLLSLTQDCPESDTLQHFFFIDRLSDLQTIQNWG